MAVDVTENRASRIGEWPSKDMAIRKLEKSLRDNSRIIATAVGGEVVTVDLIGDPEEPYRVEWGDGAMERGEFPDAASVHMTHEYAAGTEVYKILQWGSEADIRTLVIADTGGTAIGQLEGIEECGLILVIDLSGIDHINGALSVLSHKPDITDLVISGSDLAGDIVALAAMLTLANVDLHVTSVSGDLGGIDTLVALTDLDLSSTAVTGTIADLPTAALFESLILSDTALIGTIGSLDGYTTLLVVNLSSSGVTGTVANITSLEALTELNISDTAVNGAISNLDALTTLQKLIMNNSSVTGSLADITGLVALTDLDCNTTAVNGAISNLAATLVNIDLKDSSVSGDLISLAALIAAESINLDGTSVNAYTTVVPAYLTGDTGAEATFGTWAAVTDGSFRITIDGVAYNIDAINFTGDLSMDDVAATIQAAVRAETSSLETVAWSTNHFVITTVDSDDSAITVTETSTGTVGTDISGAGTSDWMDADATNGVVTARVGDNLPAWDGIALDLQNLTITNTEIDTFLQDLLADGAINGTLDMTGSTARTSASDAAVTGLIAVGWTLTLPDAVG